MRVQQCSFRVTLEITISLSGGIATTIRADDAEIPVLRGLEEVSVHVEDLDFRVERVGLTTDHLKTNAESKLKRAGTRYCQKEYQGEHQTAPNFT